ncbi:hybrid sensor histidine kinase/response regulator [Granulosicoccus sp. 3-233]|uniref:hybrid sensor histidine kinase/response regulator n=1 Tax=Granulosicoccus sp. 3-233 TaxID=3417969 RepID=UPI003D349B65
MDESDDDSVSEDSLPAPDFSHEALAHLRVQADDFALHLQVYLDNRDASTRQLLCDDLKRFRNTLVLLDKGAAVYVAEELLALLDADQQGQSADEEELGRVLLLASDQLSEHVTLLQGDITIDNALPLLPLVNDSRACRNEALLSDVLVLAAGIELPQPGSGSVAVTRGKDEAGSDWPAQRQAWVDRASAAHAGLAQRLLDWWRNADDDDLRAHKLRLVAHEIDALADFCESRKHLDILLPLFQAASLVARATADGQLTDGAALRSLYAQLERSLHRCAAVANPEDLLPGDLLRNFLYYVAQTESEDPAAIALRRRFRLDRIRQAARANQSRNTPTIGVGYHLSRAIRNSLAAETHELRQWLESDIDENGRQQPKLIRLRVRLSQLEPVLTLMGATQALSCLQSINADLRCLDEQATDQDLGRTPDDTGDTVAKTPFAPPATGESANDSSAAETPAQRCQRLAESLLLLDTLLDQNARDSIRRSTSSGVQVGDQNEQVYVDMAIDACLREARGSLHAVADSLTEMFHAQPLASDECQTVARQLEQVNQALQILPLPEVTPLLRGLVDVLTHLQVQGGRQVSLHENRSMRAVHEEIATLLVSMDYYLGCVLQPQASAGVLLVDAEEALLNACNLLGETPQPSHAVARDKDVERSVFRLLPFWDALGEALVQYRASPSGSPLAAIGQALGLLLNQARQGGSPAIVQLAGSASDWFERGPVMQQVLEEDQLSLLEEVHGVIPQLIDQWLSHGENPRGFADLLSRLDAVAEPFDLHDTGGLTLNVDDDLLSDTLDDSIHAALDNTLEHVFHFECLGHLDDLEASVSSALQPSADLSLRLPTEQMLRALHTMAGSAQTVGATGITAIVQPLQRVALTRQREGTSFDATETRYIRELLRALRARLHSLATGEPVTAEIVEIEARLPGFMAKVIPGSDTQSAGPALSANIRSLHDVFAEEARELLDRLRRAAHSSPADGTHIDAALAVLHTLKGSARMAGRMSIAEHAHSLERQLQAAAENSEAQQEALKDGLMILNSLVFQASAQASVADADQLEESQGSQSPSSEPLLVSDAAFDGLLELATDVTVNQARLNHELGSLREICQDIETTSARWQALPQAEQFRNTPAMNEILADLDAAHDSMRLALHRAEREQQHSSRAAASLQQGLIRTRLVRVDEIEERLAQAVQDAADLLGCRACIRISGGEVTLDRALFRQLQAPLEHLVRNCIVHGIESEEERLQAGKQAMGTVSLLASVDGTDLVIEVHDDGRGIDRAELNRVLQARGEAPIQTHEQLQATLFRSGFTRIASPTPVGGHGLGLAAVDASLRQLRGHVQIATQPGEGTRVCLRIPQHIVVNQVVLVEEAGVLFAMPVNQVDSVNTPRTRVEAPERYRPISLSRLIAPMDGGDASGQPVERAAVLVSVSGQQLALEVDRVIGYRELVTQALGSQMASLKCYSGGSVLADGRQVLILDLNRIVEMPRPDTDAPGRAARSSRRPVALVVDDSLTMRVATDDMLQQSGIAVRQCRDGVEALESMASALPDLIILDLDMPRLDGLGFLRQIRRRYAEACPPVIIISSRDDEANRHLAESLGVVRFLPKPYDAEQLQDAIQAAGFLLPDLTIA